MIAAHNGLAGGVFTIEGLGDVLPCAGSSCANGLMQLQQLATVFKEAKTRAPAVAARWAAQVASLHDALEALGNPGFVIADHKCCTMRDLGVQADDARLRILGEMNAAGVPQAPGSSPGGSSLWLALLGVAAVGGVAVFVYSRGPQLVARLRRRAA